MTNELLPTTVVGSYVQPEWLVDRDNLKGRLPPRVRALEMWRIDPAFLEDAQDDATLLAIRDMERAGIDIVSDGEVRRESYSNRVATALGGIDIENPGTAIDRTEDGAAAANRPRLPAAKAINGQFSDTGSGAIIKAAARLGDSAGGSTQR